MKPFEFTELELDRAIEHFVPGWEQYTDRVLAFDRASQCAFLKEHLNPLDQKQSNVLKVAGRYMLKHGMWKFK